jgi:RNA polymerase sigma-70 factor, ECF subfamily
MALTHPEIIRTLLAARPRLLAAAWVVVADAHLAEDIFQTVSVRAMEPELEFASEPALLSWAHVVARREGLQWLRKHRRESVGLDEDVLELVESEWVLTSVEQTSREAEMLAECLKTVSEASRRLLELRYFEDRSCGEVADVIGCGLDAVYQRLSRLHRALKTCIETRIAQNEPQLGT